MRGLKQMAIRRVTQCICLLGLAFGWSQGVNAQVFFEAECGVTGNIWTAESDTLASESVHIENTITRGFTVISGTQPIPDLVQYTVTVPTPGTYDIYMRESHNGFNSIQYSLDNNVWALFDPPSTANVFTWVDLEATLSSGTYNEVVTTTVDESVTIFFSYGDAQPLRVDKFALLLDDSAIPTDPTTDVGTCFDFGDAPDTTLNTNGTGDYTTLLANTTPGPINAVDPAPAVFLGSTAPDVENDGLQSTDADGDDASDEGEAQLISTAGGNAFPDFLDGAGSYSISVDVTNSKIVDAVLLAWLDFDRNGVFDQDERATATVAASAGAVQRTLTWTGIPSVGAGDLYMRLRVSTDPEFLAVGLGSTVDAESIDALIDGETEDHKLTVVPLCYAACLMTLYSIYCR